jgi:hypothetical protein
MATLQNLNIDDTGHLTLPSGTTAQRPGSAQEGYVRFNTTIQSVEYFDGTYWRDTDNLTTSTHSGASVTEAVENGKTYTVYTFTGAGTFTINSPSEIEYCVVAGGGGGGGWGGGGGGGGVLHGATLVTPQTYTVTVGGGGNAAGRNPGYVYGDNGGNSSITGSGFNLTASGGGGGAPWSTFVGRTGGSGGGGSGSNSTRSGFIAGQGNAGGTGPGTTQSGPYLGHGGGGGAGEQGENGPSPRQRTIGGKGGDGRLTTIRGFPMWYGGGGGGHSPGAETTENSYGGKGGGGGGGNYYNPIDAYFGGTNTGGGGGGAYGAGANGLAASGGSGVVIVRHRKRTGILSIPPRIPQQGLSIHLDGSSQESYDLGKAPNTWVNLAGKAPNATIYGGTRTPVRPSFTQTPAGSLEFNGTDVYAQIDHRALDMDYSRGQTIAGWIYPSENDGSRRNIYDQAYGGQGTLTHEPSGSISYYFGTNGSNGSAYVGRGSNAGTFNQELAFFTVTRDQDADTHHWYKNGELIVTNNAGGYDATVNGTNPIRIGLGYTTYYQGRIYEIMVYDMALSDLAVKQMYNALRMKYGM